MAFGRQHTTTPRPVVGGAGGRARRIVRRCALGSEALYEIVAQDGELVTAAVLSAPGLARGTRLRLLAREVDAMESATAAEAASVPAAFRPHAA